MAENFQKFKVVVWIWDRVSSDLTVLICFPGHMNSHKFSGVMNFIKL